MKFCKPVFSMMMIAVLGMFAAGCKHQQNESDAIHDAITQHLRELKTLNLSAMDMGVTNISIQGNQASADVSYRPKTGAPTGASMQISYKLEKRDGAWAVLSTAGMGGMIDHPPAGANPHTTPGLAAAPGGIPDIRAVFPPSNAAPNQQLPPGHPPVKSSPHP
ncbi:MAG TPA: hypothetical protein VN774_05635 [Candidatus Limnocylindrales bacterium]|nr:hypothetical protein [Candidatus Limnocylindrales bacterium]